MYSHDTIFLKLFVISVGYGIFLSVLNFRFSKNIGINAQPTLLASTTTHKCHNRFDASGFQVDKDCNKCALGTHENEGKCVSNSEGCSKKLAAGETSCKKCSFWYWKTVSAEQGNYCYNRWWMWAIIFSSALIGLVLLVSIIGYLSCCDGCCSKKQKKTNKYEEVHVQKSKDKKKSSGCCGGSKKKKNDSYDQGYEKPGFCDCMCLAGACGGCCGACGCTMSKCCRKKDRYVSGYGMTSSHRF